MGNGYSIDRGLKKDLKSALDGLDEDEQQRLIEKMVNQTIEEANGMEDEDDGPDFQVMFLKGDDMKIKSFDKKKQAKKKFNKAKKKGMSAVMIKAGNVAKTTGDIRKIIFILGVGAGRGDCSYGPLADDDSPLCIFENAGENEEADGGDSDSDDDDDDDNFIVLKISKNGGGIVSFDFNKKKKAKKKFNRVKGNGHVAVFCKGGNVADHSDPGGDETLTSRLIFSIGVAFGRGYIDNFGPCGGDGELSISESFDSDDSDSD